ncbi:MAG TPA: WecB/TagA/CpsF family glycosyltransferase [Planctomycetota bacterium]|nr:WecB/TagA/CpsF family glycosyltransferase [Planctomycetota bacterium]
MSDPAAPAARAGAVPTIQLLGIEVHAISEAGCVERIVEDVAAGRGGWVVTPNLDHLRRMVREREFRELCSRADLRVPDGMPLIWAAALQGTPLPERVAGSNLIWSLNRAAAERGLCVFLLGGDPGTADQAAAVLRERFPGLQVVGTHCPAPGFEKEPTRMQALIDALELGAPQIVFVALGSPKQELLIEALRARWPRAWWLGVGISFSFVTGAVRRAPVWMQKLGIEWLHRLAQDPRRLFRRYVIDGLPFAFVLLTSSAWSRLSGRRASKPAN